MRDHRSNLTAALLLSLLPLLARGQGVKTFELFQGTAGSLAEKAGSSPQPATSDGADTASFTSTPNTYYRGPDVLSLKKNVETPEDCLSLCIDDSRCEFWSHCPTNETAGCEVMTFCTADKDSATDSLDAGTCILSRGVKRSQKDYLFMEGDEVAWTGGLYAPDNGEAPSPGGAPPVVPPGKSPSPPGNSTKACPEHKAPTDWTLTASHDTVRWPVSLSTNGKAPQCFDLKKDDFTDSPSSYAACRPASAEANKTVQTLAQKLCDGTTGSGKNVDTTAAQSTFFSAIQAGGQKAIDAVAALLYAQFDLNCWQGSTVLDVLSPPLDEVKGSTLDDSITNLIQFYTDVANAGEYAGMGLCATFYSMQGEDDTTKELLTTVHTGTSK